ncbi:MAG: LytR C-terminal domain-containing protein [Actinomycetota bacterium]
MATSTLRAIILAAAVVVGFVSLTRAFPQRSSPIGIPATRTAAPAPSPSVTNRPTPTATATPRVEGVVVQVLNGSGVDFLAATVSKRVKRAGYTVKDPGNATHTPVTIVYYQAGFNVEAEFLKTTLFPNADVRPATQAAASDADLTVILGEDASPTPSG